jgi:hypothetical protein
MAQDLLSQAKNKIRPVMKGLTENQLSKLAKELVEFSSIEIAPGKCITLV